MSLIARGVEFLKTLRRPDLAPVIPPFMSRICSGYGPDRTGL